MPIGAGTPRRFTFRRSAGDSRSLLAASGKLVLAPDGAETTAASVTRRVDDAMIKAIARSFRWRDMLESGEYATIREIANAEKINETYIGRVLLTLLAPDIIEVILNGRHSRLQLEWGGLLSSQLRWSGPAAARCCATRLAAGYELTLSTESDVARRCRCGSSVIREGRAELCRRRGAAVRSRMQNFYAIPQHLPDDDPADDEVT
jgi:hypothetical protein